MICSLTHGIQWSILLQVKYDDVWDLLQNNTEGESEWGYRWNIIGQEFIILKAEWWIHESSLCFSCLLLYLLKIFHNKKFIKIRKKKPLINFQTLWNFILTLLLLISNSVLSFEIYWTYFIDLPSIFVNVSCVLQKDVYFTVAEYVVL